MNTKESSNSFQLSRKNLFKINYVELCEQAENLKGCYETNTPFPNIFSDNFLIQRLTKISPILFHQHKVKFGKRQQMFTH